MNRRRTTKGLSTKQVKEIHGAWHYAAYIRRPLNALISFRPFDPDGRLTPEDHCRIYGRFRNKLGVYARQKGFDLTYVWTRESNLDGTGEHLHVLMHVPRRHWQQFRDQVIGWHPGPAEIDVTPADQRTRITDHNKRLSAVGYILKQMDSRAWFKRGLIRKKGGPVFGKRGGVSRNINWRAQASDEGQSPGSRIVLQPLPCRGGTAARHFT
jgi:hypothetical protein